MKLITDYYKFERLKNQKSKNRLDCIASSNTYPDFDDKPFIYIGASDHIKTSRQRKADLSVTNGRGKHVSSIYKPDTELNLAYGDMRGTTDLLLFVFGNFSMSANGTITDGATVEVFICRGKKNDKNAFFNLFADGELNNEMSQMRTAAVTKTVTDKKEKKE